MKNDLEEKIDQALPKVMAGLASSFLQILLNKGYNQTGEDVEEKFKNTKSFYYGYYLGNFFWVTGSFIAGFTFTYELLK